MENMPVDSSLRQSMTRRLKRRAVAGGEIRLPAAPGMVDEYVVMCDGIFTSLGVHFSPDDLDRLRAVLLGELERAYGASQRSDVVITYEVPTGMTANYRVTPQWLTIGQAYDNWVATRQPPLFGTEPDARVTAVAAAAGDPAGCPVLDIGAGTGRNSLALARRGHPVDAVEMTEKFAEIIGIDAAREGLSVRVLRRDVFATLDDLRTDYRLILLSEVVSDFRDAVQLRKLFELAAHCLAPGGELLFNIFLPKGDYVPDDAALQLGQQCYTAIFTRSELAAASAGLPLELVADDSVHDYEKAHLPADAWPPTSWYANWVNGQDVFDVPADQCPIEMRWLVFRKPE